MRRLLYAFTAVLVVAISLDKTSTLAHPHGSSVTWSDIGPLLDRRCGRCHAPGRIAQPTLAEYEDAVRWGRALKESVLERRMPPWHAMPGFGDFANDPRLTPSELELIVSWVDGGRQRGKVAAPTPGAHATDVPAREPDLVIDVGRDYPVQSARQTHTVRPALTIGHWVEGWQLLPGNPRLVSSALVKVGNRTLGSWRLDEGPVFFPPGIAQWLAANVIVTLELAYKEPATGTSDRSRIALFFASGPVQPLKHMMLHRGATDLRGDIRVIALRPSSLMAGQSMRIIARRPDEGLEPLLWVRNYDAANPETYRLRSPKSLPKGTRIHIWSFDPDCAVELSYVVNPSADQRPRALMTGTVNDATPTRPSR